MLGVTLKSCYDGQEKCRELALWEQCRGKRKEMKPYKTKITINYFLNAWKKKQTGLGTGKLSPLHLIQTWEAVRLSHQTAVVPKAFIALLVDKWMKQLYKQIPTKRWTLVCRCLLADRKLLHSECNKIVKMHLMKSPKCDLSCENMP